MSAVVTNWARSPSSKRPGAGGLVAYVAYDARPPSVRQTHGREQTRVVHLQHDLAGHGKKALRCIHDKHATLYTPKIPVFFALSMILHWNLFISQPLTGKKSLIRQLVNGSI